MPLELRFESAPDGGYVGVTAASPVHPGPIATMNAGSSNLPIYFQVGGSGVNGAFQAALGPAETRRVNAELTRRYEARFGEGSRQRHAHARRSDVLTTLYVPLSPGEGEVDVSVRGMLYAVGPVLGRGGLAGQRAAYRSIYADAMAAVCVANRDEGAGIEAIRLVLVSTGIYAQGLPPEARSALSADAATLALEGLADGTRAFDAAHQPGTLLVNCGGDKELLAFACAALRLDLPLRLDPEAPLRAP